MATKCKCGGKLKTTYYNYDYMPGYKCILFCDKSKCEVIGGGIFCSKKDAKLLALEKLERMEKEELIEK